MKKFLMLAILTFMVIVISPVAGATGVDEFRFQGAWHSGSGSNIVTEPLTRAEFVAKGEELTRQGLRLDDVETGILNGQRLYVGNWVSGTDSNIFNGPMRLADFRREMRQRRNQGLRLVDFEVIRVNGTRRYLGVWRAGSGRERLTTARDLDSFLDLGNTLSANGFRLIDVEIVNRSDGLGYIGLWRKGSGSNLFTAPRRPAAFRALRDQMLEDGLELVDFERVRVNDQLHMVGVWHSGDGEGILTVPRLFPAFVDLGENLTGQGKRLADLEIFKVTTTSTPPDDPNGSGGASTNDLPDLPRWIELSGSSRVIIDFGLIIDNHRRVTLPVDFLPEFLPLKNGQQVIPDNFCGLRIIQADSFFWHTQDNQVFDQFPYNNVPDVSSLGDNAFLGGIDFTGPMGACLNFQDNFHFPFPLTQTGESPVAGLKLIFQLASGSRIEFLNFNVHAGEALNAHELYSDKVFKKLKNIAELFESQAVDNGYCSIDNYVQKVCSQEQMGKAPIGSCPVSDDFSSPC